MSSKQINSEYGGQYKREKLVAMPSALYQAVLLLLSPSLPALGTSNFFRGRGEKNDGPLAPGLILIILPI